jgi:acetylornithine deacetylase/succinyl-diaminopimelate desuccinylase-like protein
MTINEPSLKIDTDRLIKDLQRLIKFPSVSAKKQNLEECAKEIVKIMKEIGIFSELIYIDKDNPNSVPPIVYGEVKSKSNPNGKTILFYNHYDVQPEEPLDLWEYNPFEGIVKDNKIFGRGASDDKGELITRLYAVEYLLKQTGDVPINIKFLVEGEEENGSNNISNYINKYRNKFKTDLVIWEFGYIDQNNHPIISLGMKGLLYIELTATGPSREASFKKEYGINKFVNNINGKDIKKALINEPTCNITGLISGYTGEGAKTIIPSKASAKIDFRLVPNMDPYLQFERLKKHMEKKGFGDIQIAYINGEASGRTEIHNPYVKLIQESANRVFGDSTISVSSAGTGPMYEFIKLLKAPCISIGGTHIFSRIHSPNEYARIDR